MLRTRGAKSVAKSDVQHRYFGLLRCVGCFPDVCSEDALKGIFDDHGTARRALKCADVAENSIERSWSQHHARFTLRAVWQTRFHPLSPSNGISILQRGSPWSGSAFYQRLHGAGLLVVKHRAEIAHIKPVFKEVKLDRGRPMASAKENS